MCLRERERDVFERERERERQRQRQRQRETETETDRQTDRQSENRTVLIMERTMNTMTDIVDSGTQVDAMSQCWLVERTISV